MKSSKRLKSDEYRYKCCSSTGEALQILKRKTPTGKMRDYCLGRAVQILTEQVASLYSKATIKIVWRERRVQVKAVGAFVQAKTDDRGSSCGTFVSIHWTDRPFVRGDSAAEVLDLSTLLLADHLRLSISELLWMVYRCFLC